MLSSECRIIYEILILSVDFNTMLDCSFCLIGNAVNNIKSEILTVISKLAINTDCIRSTDPTIIRHRTTDYKLTGLIIRLICIYRLKRKFVQFFKNSSTLNTDTLIFYVVIEMFITFHIFVERFDRMKIVNFLFEEVKHMLFLLVYSFNSSF